MQLTAAAMWERLKRGVVPTALLAIGISAPGCDTMIADRMVIRAPATPPEQKAESDQVVALIHETLIASKLEMMRESRGIETWRWKGDKPPGFTVTVQRLGDEVQVRLAQDLYGPTGPSDEYEALKAALRKAARERFGKESVRFE